MLIGLESFSYHLSFSFGKMDLFSFIRKTKELGLDGVEINIEGDDLGHLKDDSQENLRQIRALCEDLGLFIELDACGTAPAKLRHYLEICTSLGADRLRTYSSFGGDVKQEMAQAIRDFKEVAPAFADAGVRIAYENHEYESSDDILRVIEAIGSPVVGAHIDTGNSMMLWEDPVMAVRNMAPKAVSSHFKDHLVIEVNGMPMIVGVPLGSGAIDLAECYRILAEETDLSRINIEVCYGYLAPFRVEQAKGEGASLGEGPFVVVPPPFNPTVVAPHLLKPKKDGFKSYAWQENANLVDEGDLDQLIAWQERSVAASVEYVKRLRDDYQGG
ncbi:xylose isomerase [Desulfosarcina widdelii]|uniref:Xylose isomerase n=1 Tax=Desulfosarcina widdelii TaxID=947919 RepID=A0A5K7YVB2_9BACT|nr:sugar phosphate isomerase/epimerase family protein [Desulfosarcina widdelii]BBO73246.1 xylose isomerase [Desulfosarcina widdelii]